MELDQNFYNEILAIIDNNLSIEKDEYGYYIKGKSECAKYLCDTIKQAVENVVRFLDSAILKEAITEKYQIDEPYGIPPIMPDYDFLKPFKPDDTILNPSELYIIGNGEFDKEKCNDY